MLLAGLLTGACAACAGGPDPAGPSTVKPTPLVTPTGPTRDPAQFQQTFWDELIHDQFDHPGGVQPLRRLTAAPRIYLTTVDAAGQPIDATTLQTVDDAINAVALIWGGGQFGLAGLERGTGTMVGRAGWYTVSWPNPPLPNVCGLTQIAVDGGSLQLNYLRADASCGCNGSKIRPRTVYHELGHAFGYFHTDSDQDVMRQGVNGCADVRPSAREVYHAQLAYATPVGSTSALPRSPFVILD